MSPNDEGSVDVGFVVFDSLGAFCPNDAVGVNTFNASGVLVNGLDFDIVVQR